MDNLTYRWTNITILYHLHQCRYAHHEIFHAKVGKGGIKSDTKPLELPKMPNRQLHNRDLGDSSRVEPDGKIGVHRDGKKK